MDVIYFVFTLLNCNALYSECNDPLPEIKFSSNNWEEKNKENKVDTVITFTCLADTSKKLTAICDNTKFRWKLQGEMMECPKPKGENNI